jgi:transposase-like protein
MARPRTEIPKDIVCRNKSCRFFLKTRGRNLIKSGKNLAGHQRYLCKHCGSALAETAGTIFYRKKLSKEEIVTICKHLVEKNGVRSVERLTGHHRDTVGSLMEELAENSETITNTLVKDFGLKSYEVDEIFTTVKKNKRKLSSLAVSGLEKAKCVRIRA